MGDGQASPHSAATVFEDEGGVGVGVGVGHGPTSPEAAGGHGTALAPRGRAGERAGLQ